MTRLFIGPPVIRSRISPEVAIRLADGLHGQRWTVSWLRDQGCTREQALAALVLDDLLTDPGELDSAIIMQMAAVLAREIGLPLQDALIRLSKVKNHPGYLPSPLKPARRSDPPGTATG